MVWNSAQVLFENLQALKVKQLLQVGSFQESSRDFVFHIPLSDLFPVSPFLTYTHSSLLRPSVCDFPGIPFETEVLYLHKAPYKA